MTEIEISRLAQKLMLDGVIMEFLLKVMLTMLGFYIYYRI